MGKGFAVVAGQISKLAEQSNESAKQIEEIITTLMEDSEKAVATMDEVKEIMNSQSDMVSESGEVFKKVLTDNGAEILNEEAWGLKKMAYAIQKKSTGFYCLVEFKAEPEVIKTLETAFRRDEKVIRFQTVKLDKYAAEYAEKRRNKLGKKEEA